MTASLLSQLSVCVLSALFLGVLCPASAQEITGSITGVVSDNSGAVVPEATVIAANMDTGAEARVATDGNGLFLLPLLRAGRYRLGVEKSGFQRHQIDDVRVNTSERLRIDITLNVGAVTETVSVTAVTPLLQSEQVTIGHVVAGETITSIPLATRNFTQILGTSAGVVGAIMNADNRGTGSDSVSVNGARRGSNNLLVDGVPTTNQLNNAPDGDGTPSIEFLSEFKVLTSLYSAEFGRNSGSVINVTTRSGTNALHGNVYEFLRNTQFNARPFFFPARRPNNQNQFGANAGGAIMKDRTFFFGGWESSRQRNGNGGGARLRVRTPTVDQRQGRFGVALYDPQARAPFPNNTIPASRIHPVSKNITDRFFPLPNLVDPGSAANFEAFKNEPTDLDQYTVRIDHRFSDRDMLNARWFESFQKDLAPFGKGNVGFGNFANREKHTWGVTHTHMFSSRFVMETRFSGDYTDQFTFGENRTDPTTVGLQPIAGVTFAGEAAGMPRIQIPNYIQFGNDAHWSDFIDRYVGGATFTWMKSNHNFRFGGETQASLLNPQNNLQTRGRWIFQGVVTGQSGARGDEYADFLLAMPFTKTFGAADEVNIGGQLKLRSHLHSFFINDDWKINRNVTFTWGLRYEMDFQAAAYNLNMLNFWPERYRGIDGTMESTGLVQGGINGVPRNTVNGDWNNFMPRIGLAWRIGDKWVIRSGAGLYFDLRTGQIAQQAFQNPPTYTEITADCVRGVLCTPGVPDNFAYLNPGHTPGLVPFPKSPAEERSVRGTERIVKTDNAWQYNFSIQRELPGNMLVETAYVGTKGTHLMAQRNFNPLIPAGGGPLVPGARLVRLFPGFGDLLVTAQNGDSTYHSFQLTVKKRVARANFQLAYTVAKTLGNGNESARFFTALWPTPWNDFSRAKGPANFDRPQRLSLVFNYDLPNAFQSGVGKAVLNNWSVNGFLVVQSGVPLTVTDRDSGRGLGGSSISTTATNLFANVNAGVPLLNGAVNGKSTKENLDRYINPAAFSRTGVGVFGNAGRGMFRGPGQGNLDFSLFKDIPIKERYTLQFRTEMFNLFNHANFGDPVTALDNPNYGTIRSTTVNARLIQFALKFAF
jgi:hypothetical protein